MARKIGLPFLAPCLACKMWLGLNYLGWTGEGSRYLERGLALCTTHETRKCMFLRRLHAALAQITANPEIQAYPTVLRPGYLNK